MLNKDNVVKKCQELFRQLEWTGLNQSDLEDRVRIICTWVEGTSLTWEDLGFTEQDVQTQLAATLAKKKRVGVE